MEQIFGYVERITYQNPENGYAVIRLKQPRKSDLTTVVGSMPGVQVGESVRLQGEWKRNPKHGLQFAVKMWQVERPSDIVGIRKYLASGMVKGIGPKLAERIVDYFKEKTLDIIDENPDRLDEVEGIGDHRVTQIKRCWQEQRSIREVMLFLQKYGVSPALAHRIYRRFGNEALEQIQANPYALAQQMRGVGFKTADQIAEKLGFPRDSEQRIDAGIEHLLHELSTEGHTCYPLDELSAKAEEMLGAYVRERIDVLAQADRIVIHDDHVWLKGLWICEQGIMREIERLKRGICRLRDVDQEKAVDWAEEKLSIQLATNQREAVKRSLCDKLHIITGGPGTGKSTITNTILTITERLSREIILAAPTGRAAKRMSEITKRHASTIHSLLKFDFTKGTFKYNRDHPLSCDLIVIDEASMIDTGLMYHLLRAIPTHARVLLVGDIHQLPSVGPGNVLRDLIASEELTVTELTEIFRQAAGSRIITNAHKINNGEFPDISIEKKSDFFFIKGKEPEDVLQQIIALVTERLPKFYRFDPIEDIQVLVPMKRGVIGIDNLNHVLQSVLNPQEDVLLYNGSRYGVGDKVMQIRNDYTKEISNGDIGRIVHINREAQELTVKIDHREILYPFSDLDALVLAYATSIHKYQGSECPCVVIPVHTTHFVMLHRNLLYTGVTRGKKLVVLVGTGKAISIAIANDEVKKRHTGLFKNAKETISVLRNSDKETEVNHYRDIKELRDELKM